MSDFLTNLVMRSFSGTPSVQPMTHSTYAAPEALPEPAAESLPSEEPASVPRRQFASKQQPQPHIEPVQTTGDHKSLETRFEEVPSVSPIVTPEIQMEVVQPDTPELEKSVFPSVSKREPPRVARISSIETPSHASPLPETRTETRVAGKPPERAAKVQLGTAATPDNTIPKPEIKTEIQPAQLIYRTPIQTVKTTTRRTTRKPANASSAPEQTPPRPEQETSPEPNHEHEIVEHVIERSSATPPVTHSVTIEKTQQSTASFTTLIPNTPPQPLPALRSRPRTPPPDLPDEVDQPVPQPETVINVAIGRIEVRATPAATPKRERQQHGPKVMTLDDYVQQRSRGTQ